MSSEVAADEALAAFEREEGIEFEEEAQEAPVHANHARVVDAPGHIARSHSRASHARSFNAKGSTSTRSAKESISSPPDAGRAKPHKRANYSFNAHQLWKIEQDNHMLMAKLEAIHQKPSQLATEVGQPVTLSVGTAGVNRRKAEMAMAVENQQLYQRLLNIRADKSIDRQELARSHFWHTQFTERRERMRQAKAHPKHNTAERSGPTIRAHNDDF